MTPKLNKKQRLCSLLWSTIFLAITLIALIFTLSYSHRKALADGGTYTLSFDHGIGMADVEKAENFVTNNATVTTETENVVYGNAIKIKFKTQYNNSVIFKFPVIAGKTYSISFWADTTNIADASKISVSYGINKFKTCVLKAETSWEKYTCDNVTAETDGDLSFSIMGFKNSIELYLDELYIRETIAPIAVKTGEKIGELPTVPTKNGENGVWAIDGKAISADTIWTYTQDKTAISTYVQTSMITFVLKDKTHTETLVKGETLTLNREYLENIIQNSFQFNQVALVSYVVANGQQTIEKTAEEEYSFSVGNTTQITLNVVNFYTLEGASIRLNQPTGIRFETHIDTADYQALLAMYDEVCTGTYILPYSYLQGIDIRTYLMNPAHVAGEDYVDVANNGFYNQMTSAQDGYYQYYGSLVGIRDENYTCDMLGVGYIKLRKDDAEILLLGNNGGEAACRNVYEVAVAAYEDTDNTLTGTYITALEGYLNRVAVLENDGNGKLKIKDSVVGYTAGYTLQETENANEYRLTAAPNTTINALFIDGVEMEITIGASLIITYAQGNVQIGGAQ